MDKRFLLLLYIPIFFSCQSTSTESTETSDAQEQFNALNEQFDSLKNVFVEELWQLNPVWASYEGYHKYDSLLPIPSAENDQMQLDFADRWEKTFAAVEADQLKDVNLTDLQMMQNHLASVRYFTNRYQGGKWNPASYNLGGSFFQVLNYRKHSLEKRLADIHHKLKHVPAYYNSAKQRIENPTIVHTKLAIQQLKGSVSTFDQSIRDSLTISSLDEELKATIDQQLTEAVDAINAFVNHLEGEVLPNLSEENARPFQLGEALYEEKFDIQIQSGFTAKEIYQKALSEKERLHQEMFRLSDELWPKYFGDLEKPGDSLLQIRQVIDTISFQHVHRDSFITAIRQQIPELEAFVQQNDLLTLDPTKPLVVRPTPEYMRGVAGASISAPGPYDGDAETYYNVTPLDHYSAEGAESYLREYNHYVLQVLNIHEAIPGHYTQLVYSNQSPSLIKSILGNGAMVEGWAVYTERMMLENGYGQNEPEMWLMYYKWNLRTICNTILDYSVHVLGMEEEAAMDLLVNQAFQETSEAKGKWRRVRVSQVQLCSYFTGYYEIMALREEMKQAAPNDFNLKAFHEKFLSYGSAPVKYIRELMLQGE